MIMSLTQVIMSSIEHIYLMPLQCRTALSDIWYCCFLFNLGNIIRSRIQLEMVIFETPNENSRQRKNSLVVLILVADIQNILEVSLKYGVWNIVNTHIAGTGGLLLESLASTSQYRKPNYAIKYSCLVHW